MHARKRSASEAQLPTTVHHVHKRPICAHTFPSRRIAEGLLVGDAPEGQSLLNRWVALVGDTFHALWEKSAEFANSGVFLHKGRVIPSDTDAIIDTNCNDDKTSSSYSLITPEPSPFPRSTLPSRPPIPLFVDTPSHPSGTPSSVVLRTPHPPPPPPMASTSSTPSVFPTRQKYGKQKHIHMVQHRRDVEEHNIRELEKLRDRRTSVSNELSMEQALKLAKRELAAKEGEQLAKQWQVQRAAGSYRSDLDSFADFQSYRQMVLDESGGNASLRSTPSLPDLARSLSSSGKARPRFISSRRSSFNLERTLQIAHQSLNEPRPPLPLSFDNLRLANRKKDQEIDKRIREATRLPTKLPPHIMQEVKLLRTKRGIVSKFGKEQVADVDLSRLDPGGTLHWLNDEVINFYGALILERAERFAANKENLVNGAAKKRKGKVDYLNVHYFSTFFWPKIEKSYKDTRLNKWTKKFDIFKKDTVLIPVNHGNVHWTLAAINFRKKRVESYDSMGIYRSNVYKKLRYYLQEEHMDKMKKPFDFTGWIDHYDEDTPQQENGYDCGVFTCQFMESLSRGVDDFVFDQGDMPYIRDRMTWEIGKSRLWDDIDH